MPIIPNMRVRTASGRAQPAFGPRKRLLDQLGTIQPVVPQAYLDVPQIIYSSWNKACGGIDAQLGTLDPSLRIAVIGGGISGVTTAFELAKACGSPNNVVLYEAREEIGGRTRSAVTPDGVNVAELGAMRFPPSEDLLYYYANQLGYCFLTGFPDPGKQPTIVSYQGQSQTWTSSETYPEGFETVYDGWNEFLAKGVTLGGQTVLQSADTMQGLLSDSYVSTRRQVIPYWQAYLDTFGNDSFYTGLQRIFGPNHEWDVPNNTVWTDDDFNRFASLGVGSGGFGPLYPIGFNYVFRLIPNGFEASQSTFAKQTGSDTGDPVGIQDLTRAIWAKAESAGVTLKTSTKAFVTDSVRNLDDTNTVTVTEHLPNGATNDVEYDIVIVATTTRAMNVSMSLSDFLATGHQNNAQYFSDNVCEAINDSHMTSSSKLFIRTKKFWEGQASDFPRNILSDTKAPQLYTLDYGDSDYGMVLVTYTWEDLSTQLMSVTNSAFGNALYSPSKSQLLDLLKSEITNIMRNTDYPDYADNLVPLDGEEDMYLIHWQLDANSYGAFTLAQPGQDYKIANMFYSCYNQTLDSNENMGVYIVGDAVSFSGGWIDGALRTSMNTISLILYNYGKLNPAGSSAAPGIILDPEQYNYSPGT